MSLGTTKKVLLGIIGTILLGTLGSGLWDIAGRPGVQWACRAILDIASLGSTALKDATYKDAAKGYHEEGVFVLIAVTLGMAVSVVITMVTYTVITRVKFRGALGRSPEQEESAVAIGPEGRPATKRRIYWLFRLLYVVDFIVLLVVSMYFIGLIEIEQANDAYTYFSQSMTICRPYMNEHQAQLLASRFAGIETGADYTHVVDELRSIATANHLKLPNFQPW